MSGKPLIVVNPRAGGGVSEQKWASAAAALRNNMGPFECVFTSAPGDATRIAKEQAQSGRRLIIAGGGDGTISEIANGILLSGAANGRTELGVFPLGSGGDFSRTLQIPRDPAAAARRIRDGRACLLDAGKLQYMDVSGASSVRYFVNTASFGMSGRVAFRANQSDKLLGGTLTYAMATLRTVFTYDLPEVFLQFDEQQPIRLRIVTVCVANGPSFGGGMKIAPDAKPNDGFFDIVTIGDLKTSTILLNSYRLYTGTFLSLEKVAVCKAVRLAARPVREEERIALEVDGETPGYLPAIFEMVPAAIAVRC